MNGREHQSRRGEGPIISDFASDVEMNEVVGFFVKELDAHIVSLSQALEARDLAVLRSVSHQLKGAAGGYGFPQIGESAAAVEQAALADEADVNEVRERTEALIQLCNRAAA